MSKREALLGMGGHEWMKGGHHRVYIPLRMARELLDFEVTFYKTGNVSSASIGGDGISNTRARQVLSEIDGIYYDVQRDKFFSYGGSYAVRVIDTLNEKLSSMPREDYPDPSSGGKRRHAKKARRRSGNKRSVASLLREARLSRAVRALLRS